MKRKSQISILPHSQAKLDLFGKYLWKYLSILSLAQGISKINIYDIFCGTGIYNDGKEGSPIIALNLIQKNRENFRNKGWEIKPIKHVINDADLKNIQNVEKHFTDIIKGENLEYSFNFYNLTSQEMFEVIIPYMNNQSKSERNLLFIDPYGYKEINKNNISQSLKNKRTEIFLFLPVSFMQRFKNIALESDKKCYEHLQKFINDFFPENHLILEPEKISTIEFIDYLKQAFSLNNKYYATAHSIERSPNNYFAVFFITSHILGLEKMLQTKWELDEDYGKGFRIISDNYNLFEIEEKNQIKEDNFKRLKEKVISFIKNKRVSNDDLYRFVLTEDFLPTHINLVLKDLLKNNKIKIIDANNFKEIVSVRSFYIAYKYYKNSKPRLFFESK